MVDGCCPPTRPANGRICRARAAPAWSGPRHRCEDDRWHDREHDRCWKRQRWGLPDDRCQCPHWGYVLAGGFTYRFADHEETVQAGEAFYLPPGHVPIANEPNSVIVQFSPTDELRKTEKVLFENLRALEP